MKKEAATFTPVENVNEALSEKSKLPNNTCNAVMCHWQKLSAVCVPITQVSWKDGGKVGRAIAFILHSLRGKGIYR